MPLFDKYGIIALTAYQDLFYPQTYLEVDDHGNSRGATNNIIDLFKFIEYSGMNFFIPEY
jgi:hypothetical protein